MFDPEVAPWIIHFPYLPSAAEPRLLAFLSNEMCRLLIAVHFQAASVSGRDRPRRSWRPGTRGCWTDTARSHVWASDAWAHLGIGRPGPRV